MIKRLFSIAQARSYVSQFFGVVSVMRIWRADFVRHNLLIVDIFADNKLIRVSQAMTTELQ